MSVELEARVRRANLISRDRHLERLYDDDLSHRLLRDIYSKKEGRMSDTKDRPEPTTVEEVQPDEEAFRSAPAPRQQRSPAFVPAILTAVIAIGVIVVLVARDQTPDVAGTPVGIAEAFMAAMNEHDPVAVRSLLADDEAMVGEVAGVEGVTGAGIEQQLEQEEVLGWTYHVEGCLDLANPNNTASEVRCNYAFSNHLTRAIGAGPYEGSFYELLIADGKIRFVNNEEYDDAFHEEAISAFGGWLEANHPEANDIYYEYFDEENLAKWEKYLPEFVAAMEETG
jgi:hypothetical protein